MENVNSKDKQITKIAKKFGLFLVMRFGSSLDENKLEHSESDIDIAFLLKSRQFVFQKLFLIDEFVFGFLIFGKV